MDMETIHRTVVYHETEAPEGNSVLSEDAQEWYDKGWVDTPAKFGTKEVTKKESEKPEVQQNKALGVNIKPDFKSMDTVDLKKWCDKNMPDVKYYKNAGKKQMLRLMGV